MQHTRAADAVIVGSNVLFSVHAHRFCRYLALRMHKTRTPKEIERLYRLIFCSGLAARYNEGAFPTEWFYEQILGIAGSFARARIPYDECMREWSACIKLNNTLVRPFKKIVVPVSLVANINNQHWDAVKNRQPVLRFKKNTLSFQLGEGNYEKLLNHAVAACAPASPERILYIGTNGDHAFARRIGVNVTIYNPTLHSVNALYHELQAFGVIR